MKSERSIGVELSRHELFEHLLDQLNMAKDDPAFKDGKIKQVIVHRKSKCWEFDIVLRKVMPYELFRQFVSALQISFRELAGVDAKVRIDTPTDELDAKAIGDYWSYVVDAEVGESPMAREVCAKTIPEVDGNRVQLLLENEAIKDFFVQEPFKCN
jgi:DNA polymerase III, alpha subunit (gram-positive type)